MSSIKHDASTEAKPSYDQIGNRFEEFTDSAAQRAIEIRTIFDMIGSVDGASILDLACGYGFFGRELSRRGAQRVVGVDISTEMIRLAREQSEREGDAVEFVVHDAQTLGQIGEFDLVVAAWLFNYADSLPALKAMMCTAAANLKRSGKLVAYTVDPRYSLALGNFARYGVNVLSEDAWNEGFRHTAEFVTDPPSSFTFFRWTREQYEAAAAEAGFAYIRWQAPILTSEDRETRSAGFWRGFEENCLQTGLVCRF